MNTGQLEGLRHALNIVRGRRMTFLRPPAYLAALDEIEIFLEAAMERVERGESMNAVNVVQESCSKVDYSRYAGEPE